jgi:predicted secreted protein
MSKFFGKGTRLQVGDSTDGASTTWSNIAHLLGTLSGPNIKVDVKEDNDHQNATNFKQLKPGLVDPGEISGKFGYDATETEYALMQTLAKNGQMRDFRIIAPDAQQSTKTFVAFPSNGGFEFPYDDYVTFDLTLQLTTEITEGTLA